MKREMRRRNTKRNASGAGMTVLVLRLYIADNAPNSLRAVANLEAICKQYLQDKFKLEIVDVLEYPLRALADGILVTPSLAKLSPAPSAKIVGNLSDRQSVLQALGITEAAE
jgi:circadian clock protein KaiB